MHRRTYVFLNASMNVRMYVCTYVCIYVYVYVYVYAYGYGYGYVYVCMHVCMYACLYVCCSCRMVSPYAGSTGVMRYSPLQVFSARVTGSNDDKKAEKQENAPRMSWP